MSARRITTAALALLAGLALAGSAHATNNDAPAPSDSGRDCSTGYGTSMEDGEVRIYSRRNQWESMTCTDGTICRTWRVRQTGNRWTWYDHCYDAPARTAAAPSEAPPSQTTAEPTRKG